MRLFLPFSVICTWILSVGAVDLAGSVLRNQHITANEVLPPSTAVVLNYGEYQTLVRKDGSFVIPNVQEGNYILDVKSKTHIFDSIYLTITPTTIHLQPYHPARLPIPPTETTPSLAYPIQLVPLARAQYYEEPQGANIMGLLKNPMVLMLGFTALMAIVMPKMLAGMELDPEEAQEMANMQQRIKGFQNTDWSEKLAGALAGTVAAAPAVGASEVVETGDARAIKASGTSSSANVNAKKRRGR